MLLKLLLDIKNYCIVILILYKYIILLNLKYLKID